MMTKSDKPKYRNTTADPLERMKPKPHTFTVEKSRLRDPHAKYLTFYMHPHDHTEFKTAVAAANTTMQEVLEQAVKDWLQSQKKRR